MVIDDSHELVIEIKKWTSNECLLLIYKARLALMTTRQGEGVKARNWLRGAK